MGANDDDTTAGKLLLSFFNTVNKRTLRSAEPRVMEMLAKCTNLTATMSVEEATTFSKYIYIYVQTPSTGSERHYDHTHLNDVLSQLSALKVKDKHIIIGWCFNLFESTLFKVSKRRTGLVHVRIRYGQQ